MIQIPFGAFANVAVPSDVDVTVAVPQADPLNFLTAQQPFQVVVFSAPATEGGGGGITSWNDLEDKPSTFSPSSHKSSHASGGDDALTPADIGAESVTNKGQPGGYAALDGSGKIPAAQISGLGDSATRNVGTSAGQIRDAADPAYTDARPPTAHTHPASQISDSTAAGRTLLTAADAAAQRTALDVSQRGVIRESGGPTDLSIGAVAAGGILRRAGTSVTGLIGTVDRQIAEWSGTTWAAVTAPLFLLANGARSAQIPDNTTAGGNARGDNAIDFQVERGAATQVASGTRSFNAGQNNTVSGQNAGSIGRSNTSSGLESFTVGASNTASASYAFGAGFANTVSGVASWIPGGQLASTRGIHGAHAWSVARRTTGGDNQHWGDVFQRETTDATPTILTSTRTEPNELSVMVLPNNGSWNGIISVQARGTSGNTAKWTIDLLAKRGANAAATSIVDQHVIRTFAETALAGAAVTIVANTTRGSWEVQVTGIAGVTIDWIADVTVGSLTHR